MATDGSIKLKCGKCGCTTEAEMVVEYAHYRCTACGTVNNITNVHITEWLGFNYKSFLSAIKQFIDEDSYALLRAADADGAALGMLTDRQISRLKSVLKDNFSKGGTIRDIADDIKNKVKVRDLEVQNDNGETTYIIPASARAVNIARTETTRAASNGALIHYASGGAEKYEWVASITLRTCATCESLNGRTYEIGKGQVPPAHALCRCTVVAVVE